MKNNDQSGMTLVELLIVLIVIGIISGIAISKTSPTASLTIGQQADQFVNDIRHAQSLAQTWGCQLVLIVSTTGYEVRNKTAIASKSQCATANAIVTDPSTGQNLSTTLKNGVQFGGSTTIDFDIKGQPRDNGTNAPLSALTNYTMTGGGSTFNISVSHVTGFVSMTGP